METKLVSSLLMIVRYELPRDWIAYLIGLQAISAKRLPDNAGFLLSINLDWPTKITETEFFRRMKEMPKGKVYGFLSI